MVSDYQGTRLTALHCTASPTALHIHTLTKDFKSSTALHIHTFIKGISTILPSSPTSGNASPFCPSACIALSCLGLMQQHRRSLKLKPNVTPEVVIQALSCPLFRVANAYKPDCSSYLGLGLTPLNSTAQASEASRRAQAAGAAQVTTPAHTTTQGKHRHTTAWAHTHMRPFQGQSRGAQARRPYGYD
jgi:hypothetical protein